MPTYTPLEVTGSVPSVRTAHTEGIRPRLGYEYCRRLSTRGTQSTDAPRFTRIISNFTGRTCELQAEYWRKTEQKGIERGGNAYN